MKRPQNRRVRGSRSFRPDDTYYRLWAQSLATMSVCKTGRVIKALPNTKSI